MELNENDLTTIVTSAIMQKGHAGHHIESMNYFIKEGIKQIVTEFYKWDNRVENTRNLTQEDNDIESFRYEVNYPNVYIKTTEVYGSQSKIDLTPQNARNTDRTYGVTLSVDIKITITPNMRPNAVKRIPPVTIELKEQKLSVIPIGVKSDMCVLSRYSREALLQSGEDPKDPGGYTIVGGKEWVITCLENTWFNAMSIYKNAKYEDELVRGTIIAKDGDAFENTYQNRFYLRRGPKLDYDLTISKKDAINVPFFTLFRIFGIVSDKQITELIVGDSLDSDSQQSIILRTTVESAFKSNYGPVYNKFKNIISPEENALMIGRISEETTDLKTLDDSEEFRKYIVKRIFEHFDEKVLQQYGTTPNSRHIKALITGKYFRDIILAEHNVIPTSDRDSFQVKRIHAAGITLSKSFKQQFNKMIHLKIKATIEKALRDEPFATADFTAIIKTVLNKDGPKLETALSASISRGDDKFTVKGQEVINKVVSQLLQHKNDFNVISTLNVVTAAGSRTKAAKATERADLMRRNHASSIGFICPNYSADTGEPVGINKSLASTASITLSSNSKILEQFILKNKEIKTIPLVDIKETDLTKYCLVSINGKYIGVCDHQMSFTRKYREFRRKGLIDRHVSIVSESTVAEVTFWTDYGRLIRPCIIVYNNIEEIYKACDEGREPPKFKQWIKLTKKHIQDIARGRKSIEQLVADGVMEYISASEQFNCFMTTLDDFNTKTSNILFQYTHLEIAQAVIGIIAHASPLADHSSCVRITFSTNHTKQACNRYNAGWPFRFDNNSYFAFKTQVPLVSTIADQFKYPSAQNLMIMVAMHEGRNQEDSGDINKASIQLGVGNGIYLKVENIVIPNDYIRDLPEVSKTEPINPKFDFTMLDEKGIIKKGSIVKQNTVLVAMYQRLDTPKENVLYTDKSHVYQGEEECHVHNVIDGRSYDKNLLFVRILMYAVRDLGVGAKEASRMGNKSIISSITRCSDMPYTLEGMQPDMIVNPHSFPSRMAMSQCIEGTLATYAAHFGHFIDATTFKKLDIDAVNNRLKEVKRYDPETGLDMGYHYVYNGKTGELMPVKVFLCPQVYQRLGKFVENAQYAVDSGFRYAATQQPLQGKKHKGGLRIGEMEQATINGHGAMLFLDEKFRGDSDGCIMYVCKKCKYRAVVNELNGLYSCGICKDNADIRKVPSCFVANQFFHMMDACNLDIQFHLNN